MDNMDPTNGPVKVRRALISVSDKTGLADFAKGWPISGRDPPPAAPPGPCATPG